MIIRGYGPKDEPKVRDVVKRAFGQDDEAVLVSALRQGGHMALELVAEDRGRIVGHVALSRMEAPDGWLALAPVSVDPKRQKKGIGSALCQMAVDYANAPVVVLGDPAYYARFGFDYERAAKLQTPFPVVYTGLYAPKLDMAQPEETLRYAPPFGA
ncbi:GNAT family N-acetyltransferase [Shimia sp. FJ5]|uniref:GNAT family N-acetyltransferase n=1 Tax=Shimia sp. FJ5 TaxID=3079054 RepID=UPI002602AAC8|nr:N-acetyltransferase [Shimia sp. FJ5]MDV4145911.1 N-acetyltransferase [Shimia sp. FJ5]